MVVSSGIACICRDGGVLGRKCLGYVEGLQWVVGGRGEGEGW